MTLSLTGRDRMWRLWALAEILEGPVKRFVLTCFLSLFGVTSYSFATPDFWDKEFLKSELSSQFQFKDLPRNDEQYNGRSIHGYPKKPIVRSPTQTQAECPFSAFLPNAYLSEALHEMCSTSLSQHKKIFSFIVQGIEQQRELMPEELIAIKAREVDSPLADNQQNLLRCLNYKIDEEGHYSVLPSPLLRPPPFPDRSVRLSLMFIRSGEEGTITSEEKKFPSKEEFLSLKGVDPEKNAGFFSFIAFEDKEDREEKTDNENEKTAFITYHWLLNPQTLTTFKIELEQSNTFRELLKNLKYHPAFSVLLAELENYLGKDSIFKFNFEVPEKIRTNTIPNSVILLRTKHNNNTPIEEMVPYLFSQTDLTEGTTYMHSWRDLSPENQRRVLADIKAFVAFKQEYEDKVPENVTVWLSSMIASCTMTGNSAPLDEKIAYFFKQEDERSKTTYHQVWNALTLGTRQLVLDKIDKKVTSLLHFNPPPSIDKFIPIAPALISTMPKSATIYSYYFLWCYDRALQDGSVNLLEALSNDIVRPTFSTLKIPIRVAGHWEAPGYSELSHQDPFYNIWKRLNYYSDYDEEKGVPSPIFVKADELSPSQHHNIKIVYIFRNPLDQLISRYNYSVALNRAFRLKEGEWVKCITLEEFIFKVSALKAYIKQYHTYRVLKRHFPENVLMIAYEELTSHPGATFNTLLSFIGVPVLECQEQAFQLALNETKYDSMKKIETQIGSIWEKEKGTPHVKNGATGTWKQNLTFENIKKIDEQFKRFGYSLEKDFGIKY